MLSGRQPSSTSDHVTFTTTPAVLSPHRTSLSGCGSGSDDQHQQQSTERTQHHGSRDSIPAGYVGEGRTGGDARAGSYPHAPWTLDYALRGTGEESVDGEARARLGTMRERSIARRRHPPADGSTARPPAADSTLVVPANPARARQHGFLDLRFRHNGLFLTIL